MEYKRSDGERVAMRQQMIIHFSMEMGMIKITYISEIRLAVTRYSLTQSVQILTQMTSVCSKTACALMK
jgi:hypothetical protein